MPKWTKEQQDAIDARRGTLLVSAAAGSGKTAVLVQRVIERLTDPECPTDADRLLVVTFTKAAAAEMKDRIAAALAKLLAEDPNNRHLQRQQLLLGQAQISTIHSFCQELVKEHCDQLGISPQFRILEEEELRLMQQAAVTAVLESYYEQEDAAFETLVRAFGYNRDDGGLARTVCALYEFTRSHPFPQKWLEEIAELYRGAADTAQTPWGAVILQQAQQAAEYCIGLIRRTLVLMQEDAVIDGVYRAKFAEDLAALERLREVLEEEHWDRARFAVEQFHWVTKPRLKGDYDVELNEQILQCRETAKQVIGKQLREWFCASEQEAEADLMRMAPMMEKLCELTLAFDQELQTRKAERKAATFGDLEHWALELLVRPVGDGYERTGEAVALSQRFDEVMVDEYQDTNQAQDMLFRAVSQREENLFLVGDVKQSIYGFRQAMPQIFLQRRSSFLPYCREEDRYPAYLVLDKNFRSRETVTDTINFVFSQLMSEQAGGVDYCGKELLSPQAEYPQRSGCQTELILLELARQAEQEETVTQAETRCIAEKIHTMVQQGFMITENGVQRPVDYGDFCVLLRSVNRHAAEYVKELEKHGVPACAKTRSGFFRTAEVAVMLSLLRVIDNPLQDIALAAVLMSPIYGFTPDEMAQMRSGKRKQPLYLACREYGKTHSRAAAFLQELEEYRMLAATMPADRLLQRIYQKSGYLHMVQTMPGGKARGANLQLLAEYAKKFAQAGYHGLSGFVRYVNRLERKKEDLQAASVLSEGANAVKVMSIHNSKGLEFPVCILARCGKQFNRERDAVLLHPQLGLGIKLQDLQTGGCYTTVPRRAIALELEREDLAEEMRVLYVAMTRAKEKLILLAAVKDIDSVLRRAAMALGDGEKQEPFAVNRAKSFLDWLLVCALRHPDGGELRRRALLEADIVLNTSSQPWQIQLVPAQELPEMKQKQELLPEELPQVDAALLARVQEMLAFVYPRRELTVLPAKVTASELTGKAAQTPRALARPRFMSSKGLTPAERGTALHQFMQFAEYGAANTDAKAECDRLLARGYLTPEQAQAVDFARVQAFFDSDLGRRILQAQTVEKEKRFMVELPLAAVQAELLPELQQQCTVLQGAVDCVFAEEDGLVIVDFKTDREKDPQALWERYCTQLELYAYAMEQVYQKPVKRCVLYSFYLNKAVAGAWERKFVVDKLEENC